MARYALGRKTIAECDVCGFQYKLLELKSLIRKGVDTNIKACSECWDPDHPQLHIGDIKVIDAQAVRNPRPDYASRGQSRALITPVTPVVGTVFVGTVTVETT